jgi:hypothetical protein
MRRQRERFIAMNLGGVVAALVLMGAERGILDVSGAKSCGTDSVAQLSRR